MGYNHLMVSTWEELLLSVPHLVYGWLKMERIQIKWLKLWRHYHHHHLYRESAESQG